MSDMLHSKVGKKTENEEELWRVKTIKLNTLRLWNRHSEYYKSNALLFKISQTSILHLPLHSPSYRNNALFFFFFSNHGSSYACFNFCYGQEKIIFKAIFILQRLSLSHFDIQPRSMAHLFLSSDQNIKVNWR